jgi:hypothetical protein
VIGDPIAQIFRERYVDISTQHLMRAIRLFIAEEEGTKRKASTVHEGRRDRALLKKSRRDRQRTRF